jgi:hypothetical protein
LRYQRSFCLKIKGREPWKYVNHGVDLLTSEDELNAYMLAYGEMHNVKCRAAFQNFPFDKIYSNIEIVDWGCGQGFSFFGVPGNVI